MSATFTNTHKLVKVKDLTSAGTSDVTTAGINMAGFDGVAVFSSYGTAASGNLCHLEASDDDGSGDGYSDLALTEVNVGSSDEDVYVEIHKPRKQWVRAVFERGTSSTLGDIWYVQYGARSIPIDNTAAGTQHGEIHKSPAEGTI